MNTLKQFVSSVVSAIGKLPNNETGRSTLLCVESCQSMHDLKVLLASNANSNVIVSRESVSAFLAFLENRWRMLTAGLEAGPAVYSYEINSPINLACIVLATHLANALNIDSPYTLLMPTIDWDLLLSSKGNMTQLGIHEFVFGHQLKPIEVLACLDEYAKNPDCMSLYHTCTTEKRALSAEERERVKNHSKESLAYWSAIYYGDKAKIKQTRQAFKDALDNRTLTMTIDCTYSKRQYDTLFVVVIKNRINMLFDLAVCLTKLDKHLYKPFLHELSTRGVLLSLLNSQPLESCIKDSTHYTNDECHNKAMLFIFSYIYWKIRDEESETSAYFSIFNWLHYTKGHKIAATIWLMNFLLSDHPLVDIERHIKRASSETNELGKYEHDALFDARLGDIVKMAKSLVDQQFKLSHETKRLLAITH